MDYAQVLDNALGAPTSERKATADEFKAIGAVPEDLAALWRQHGWAGYQRGFYWTTNPQEFTDTVKSWRRIPRSAAVIGRDAFANLYLLEGDVVRQLNVHRDDHDMIAPTLDLFFLACIADKSFRADYMWEQLFQKALKAQGPLGEDECYGFFPALVSGGSAEPDSLRRVKLHEHLLLLRQLHS